MTVTAADLDPLAVDDHPPLDAVLVTIPQGKKSVATATEIMIAIADGIVTALEVPSTGRLPSPQSRTFRDRHSYVCSDRDRDMKDERDDRDRKENGANGDERKGIVNPLFSH